MRSPKNLDSFTNAQPALVAKASFHVIDSLQLHPPAAQSLGLALAFLMLCQKQGLDPQDVFTWATRLATHSDDPDVVMHFNAVREYIRREIPSWAA